MNTTQNFDSLLSSLSSTADTAPSGTVREGELLLFNGSTGEWGFGAGKDPLRYGTRVIINPFGLREGYRRWYVAGKVKLPFDVAATLPELEALGAEKLGDAEKDGAALKRAGLSVLRERLPDTPPDDEDGELQEWDPEGKGWDAVYIVEGLLMPEGIRVVWSGSSGGARDGYFRLVHDVTAALRKAGKLVYPVVSLEEHKRGEGYYSQNRKKTFYKPWFEVVGTVATFAAEQASEAPQLGEGEVIEPEVVKEPKEPAKKTRRPKK